MSGTMITTHESNGPTSQEFITPPHVEAEPAKVILLERVMHIHASKYFALCLHQIFFVADS
jgi:hypothetical protein